MRPTQCYLNKDASWKHMEKLPTWTVRRTTPWRGLLGHDAVGGRLAKAAVVSILKVQDCEDPLYLIKILQIPLITFDQKSRSWCVLIQHVRFESVLKWNRQVLRPCVLSGLLHGNSWVSWVSWVSCHHNCWSLDGHWDRHWEWHEQQNEFNAVSSMKGWAETSISKLVMSTYVFLFLPYSSLSGFGPLFHIEIQDFCKFTVRTLIQPGPVLPFPASTNKLQTLEATVLLDVSEWKHATHMSICGETP